MAKGGSSTKPTLRAGMGDPDALSVEVWSDEGYRRATGLQAILPPAAGADRTAVPVLADAVWREAYRTMLRLRALDQIARDQVAKGRIGSYLETRGAEAAIVGAAAGLAPDDVVVPGGRGGGIALYRGLSARVWLAQLFGNAADPSRGRQLPGSSASPLALNVFPGAAHGGTQLPHATGIAWAAKMQRKSTVVLATLDAAATGAEDFHAGLNFAGVFRVPVVFVCLNDAKREAPLTRSETLAVKALAYGIDGVRVDGRDLLAVTGAVRAAAERARRGEGATLIEAVLDEGEPFERLRAWLAVEKILDAGAEAALRTEVEAEIRAALAAEEPLGSPPGHTVVENVLARTSPALTEQLDELDRVRDKTIRP
jgi:pyruvate dehydrogenase E1 component alpha subunit